jgi:hypothetical protein
VAAALAACGANQPAPSPSGQPQVLGAPGMLIMVIRHGEKPEGSTAAEGIDAAGRPDTHSLTPVGWARARALSGLFDPSQGPVRPGLARPVAIYAAGGTGGAGTRPRETVQPLADHLGIHEDTSFSKGEEAALITHVASQPGPILISWQHEAIPAFAAAFGPVTPTPPAAWPNDRFDVVWTFTATTRGWNFAQVPEMVLPGDSSTVLQ